MAQNEDFKLEPLRKPVKCPNCTKPSQRGFYPFCSKRCADLDLNRWFGEGYAIPSNEGAGLDMEQE